jgi:hypothetical protein
MHSSGDPAREEWGFVAPLPCRLHIFRRLDIFVASSVLVQDRPLHHVRYLLLVSTTQHTSVPL